MILARTWTSEPQTRSGLEELFFRTRNSVGIFELREDRFFKNVACLSVQILADASTYIQFKDSKCLLNFGAA